MTTAKKKNAAANSAIDAVADQFDSTIDMVQDGLNTMIKSATEQRQAATVFEGAEFPGKEHFDAALKSSEAYVAGFQELNQMWFQMVKGAVQFNRDAAQSLSRCTSAQDISAAQAKLAQSGFDAAVEASNTFGQAAMKVAEDIHAPLTNTFTNAFNAMAEKPAA